MKNKKTIIGFIVCLVLVMVISVTFFYTRFHGEIDLTEYIVIDGFSGLNGQGKIEYYLDEQALAVSLYSDDKKVDSDKEIGTKFEETVYDLDEFGNILSCISVTASPEKGLSNGDTVSITVEFSNPEEFKFSHRFVGGKITYLVTGLADGLVVEPLSDDAVSVSFSGFSGTGTAEFKINAVDEVYSEFEYYLSAATGLCNGDVVSLSVGFDEEKLAEMGYLIPETLEREFTVTGLTEYISDSTDIPAGEIGAFIDEALIETQQYESGVTAFEIKKSSEVKGVYFLQAAELSEPFKDYYNGLEMSNAVAVVAHYKLGIPNDEEWGRDEWFIWIYPNCYISEAGVFEYDTEGEELYTPSGSDIGAIEKWMEENFTGMTITEID